MVYDRCNAGSFLSLPMAAIAATLAGGGQKSRFKTRVLDPVATGNGIRAKRLCGGSDRYAASPSALAR